MKTTTISQRQTTSRIAWRRERWSRVWPAFAGLLCLAMGVPSQAAMNRFYLAEQSDFGNKRGFWVDFENSSEGDTPCRLENLKLILGMADGKDWRFHAVTPHWEYNRDYTVKAVIGPTGSALWLDGRQVADSPGGFAPAEQSLSAKAQPGWASGPAVYSFLQTTLTLTTSGGKHLERKYRQDTTRSAASLLFAPQVPERLAWKWPPDETLTITASFRLIPAGNARALAPLVDRYGQFRLADWPEKIHSDADFAREDHAELVRLATLGTPKGYDKFGGYLRSGWHEKATGFFHVVRQKGFWWLISPEGNPLFYTGVCTAPMVPGDSTPVTGREFLFDWLPPRTSDYARIWQSNPWGPADGIDYVSFGGANMIRKYGEAWQAKATERTIRRLKAWGFSGAGKWCGRMDGIVTLPVLRLNAPKLVRHPDIFDAAVQAQVRESLRRQIEPRKSDPYVLGWSIGNEYDEIITAAEIQDLLGKPADVASRRALIDYARNTLYNGDLNALLRAWKSDATTLDRSYPQCPTPARSALTPNAAPKALNARRAAPKAATLDALYAAAPQPPAADLERLRHFYADRYYDFLYRAVKQIDPDHLYFGFWIVPGWWQNASDWDLIAPRCDVIGYDLYADQFADAPMQERMRHTGKPVLCGEFSLPPIYNGERGWGLYQVWAKDDADAGAYYTRWLQDATHNPYCIGEFWFEYRDEPLTGRGPGRGTNVALGEDYAFGLVDVADNPKWDLVTAMRAANLTATPQRLKAREEGTGKREEKKQAKTSQE